jgi:hypothetical protein
VKGLLAVALGLIGLQVLVTTNVNFGGAIGAVTTWVADWMDPGKALISKPVPAAATAAVMAAVPAPVPPPRSLPVPAPATVLA